MTTRIELQQQIFPRGIPKLWCPTLSFFSSAGQFDAARIEQHLERISPFVKGLLVPGSTGEGWQMSDEQIETLLGIVMPKAAQLQMHVLISILKTETEQVLAAIKHLDRFFAFENFAGITVCPAKGAERTQDEILIGLTRVLQLELPTALYQLPQVTGNEMSPDTVHQLANDFPNFIMFKDTSGKDRVAQAQLDLGGVFLVRGSEQDGYARWLRSAGGHYDGFLLSTANCFARQLSAVIALCESGHHSEAHTLSDSIRSTVAQAFEAVGSLTIGNAFTNANKALDHLFMYGAAFREHAAPMLIDGQRLPMQILEALGQQLSDKKMV